MKQKLFFFILVLVLSQLLISGNKYPSCSTEIIEKIEQQSPLPKSYGFYIVEKDALIELMSCPVKTIIGLPLQAVNLGYAMDGLSGEPPIIISSPLPTLIVYQQNVDVNILCLSDMVFVKSVRAYQLNIKNTDRRFFSNVYKKNYNDIVEINLWRPNNEISVAIEPVEGKSGMFKLIPKSSLEPGNYAIYYRGQVHRDGMVFSSDYTRKTSSYYFKVKISGDSLASETENKPRINYTKSNMRYFLDTARSKMGTARNLLTMSNRIKLLDEAITNLNSAFGIASALKYMDALKVIESTEKLLNKANEIYLKTQSYVGISDHEEAIKVLDGYLITIR